MSYNTTNSSDMRKPSVSLDIYNKDSPQYNQSRKFWEQVEERAKAKSRKSIILENRRMSSTKIFDKKTIFTQSIAFEEDIIEEEESVGG